MTNWKERYDQLVKLVSEMEEKIRDADFLRHRIDWHVRESDRLDLMDRNKSRYMRLKEDVTLKPEYDCDHGCSDHREAQTFPAGTLIDCGLNGRVYIDDDGDGYWNFPPRLLESVEVDSFDESIDWNKVINQG